MIFDIPSDYTIIDIETTGFSVKSDKIIEFAGIKVRIFYGKNANI